MTKEEQAKHDLACEIADEGDWEEFHQKRSNFTMYDYHKNRRLLLEEEYHAHYRQLKRLLAEILEALSS